MIYSTPQMCFSARMSLFAFIIGIIGSILVYSLNGPSNKIIACFIGYVSLMQFIEYLLWNNQICNNYNKLISKIGMWLNHLQPVVLGLLVIIFNNNNNNNNNKNLILYIFIIIFIYLCVIIPYSLQYKDIGKLQCTIKNPITNHLDWNWNNLKYNNFVYTIFFCLALILIFYIGLPNKKLKIYAGIVIFVTYISSVIIYNNNIGALWCFYTVFIPIIYYLYCKIFNKFINV
jgi:hypothetical protein